jgi:hypothetical protein
MTFVRFRAASMDLVKAALPNSKMVYTCPASEVVQEGPGSCLYAEWI